MKNYIPLKFFEHSSPGITSYHSNIVIKFRGSSDKYLYQSLFIIDKISNQKYKLIIFDKNTKKCRLPIKQFKTAGDAFAEAILEFQKMESELSDDEVVLHEYGFVHIEKTAKSAEKFLIKNHSLNELDTWKIPGNKIGISWRPTKPVIG